MSGGTRWTMTAVLALGLLALTTSGCARSDWIEETLVTVDVTGVWSGSCAASGNYSTPLIEMTLEQRGPKVTGHARSQPGSTWRIQGTVNGDIFRFTTANGPAELQVSGDEMTGQLPTAWGRQSCRLSLKPPESPRPQ